MPGSRETCVSGEDPSEAFLSPRPRLSLRSPVSAAGLRCTWLPSFHGPGDPVQVWPPALPPLRLAVWSLPGQPSCSCCCPSRSSSRLGKGPHSKGRPACRVHAAPSAPGSLLLLFSAWASWLLSMTSFFSSSLLVCVGIFKIAFIKLLNLFTSKNVREKEMATHSSVLAWRIHGPRSLVGYNPWGHQESDTTEVT